ncbi:multidrug ABC transporter permease [miscellaneous Crenarchaeota group-1 archaeon SG8-32-3]|uniref:Multidrug ABC transporter permease n=1 Tax=miscellaneous Crenarchaeota group-1 archaeon SG8-32-3 TaxID=1685125 RepID=A0A0M0BTY7_9ARCH|nr:MAG: multidrug ABC transporter permease [miscellaneous Crenarchaeota group-1 archaeon SG8-32-3]
MNNVSKSKLHGLWALTNRELKKWYKTPVVFILTLLQPIIWLGLLGNALNLGSLVGSSSLTIPPQVITELQLTPAQITVLQGFFSNIGDTIMQGTFGTTSYISFMAVGMIAFTALFTTMFSGMSVVWDRRLGFLNKALSTPVSRAVIILSKVLSATLRSIFQASIILIIAVPLGFQFGAAFTAVNILGVFAFLFLICMGLSSLFIAINIRSTRIETPMAVMNLLNLPLTFASSAFFPIEQMPGWLQAVATINPLSYTMNGMRQLLINSSIDYSQLALQYAYVGLFALVLTTVGIVLSWRFLNK